MLSNFSILREKLALETKLQLIFNYHMHQSAQLLLMSKAYLVYCIEISFRDKCIIYQILY